MLEYQPEMQWIIYNIIVCVVFYLTLLTFCSPAQWLQTVHMMYLYMGGIGAKIPKYLYQVLSCGYLGTISCTSVDFVKKKNDKEKLCMACHVTSFVYFVFTVHWSLLPKCTYVMLSTTHFIRRSKRHMTLVLRGVLKPWWESCVCTQMVGRHHFTLMFMPTVWKACVPVAFTSLQWHKN